MPGSRCASPPPDQGRGGRRPVGDPANTPLGRVSHVRCIDAFLGIDPEDDESREPHMSAELLSLQPGHLVICRASSRRDPRMCTLANGRGDIVMPSLRTLADVMRSGHHAGTCPASHNRFQTGEANARQRAIRRREDVRRLRACPGALHRRRPLRRGLDTDGALALRPQPHHHQRAQARGR